LRRSDGDLRPHPADVQRRERAVRKPSEAAWDIAAFRIEWIKLGGSPSEFWNENPRSYVNAMEGMAHAAKREFDLAISTAWHTAVFALTGYGGKLKDLREYLDARKNDDGDQRLRNAQLIHYFQSMKAKGVPIDITVTKH
jgi:hypothetical protein